MRIVFLSYNYSADIHSPEAWVERIQFYVGWLESLAKKHSVIRVDQINYECSFVHNNVQYYCVNDGKKKNYFPRRLNEFVKGLKPDVVVVSSFLFPVQVIQLRSCLGPHVKLIIQHHAEKPFTGIKKWLQQMASRKINACLFASKDIGTDWVKKGNLVPELKQCEIVGGTSLFTAIDKEMALMNTGMKGAPSFLWVGRLNENKDPLTAVKAFLKYHVIMPSAKLYMIFQTTELLEEIKKLLGEQVKEMPVILVGKIQHKNLLYWFNSADFYLSASHYEGSGTALCEAMSCGCIPLVSNIPSFRTISDHCGLLFEPGNESDLLSVLHQANQIDIKEQKLKVLHHFKTELSFESIADKFQQLINGL